MSIQPTIYIVTGYSGAGKSCVLRTLEDQGFFCIDNLPLPLLDALYEHTIKNSVQNSRIALGLDIRAGITAQQLMEILYAYKHKSGHTVTILFLTASSHVLLRRFQETRRKHPLTDAIDLAQAIEQEKELLHPLYMIADMHIDTDQLNVHQLRNFIRATFATQDDPKMLINLVSFGFKYGVPQESNFVYDLRSLPNPYFVPTLKPLKGTDKEIIDFLFSKAEVLEYWDKFLDFVTYSIEQSHKEGRLFMKIAVGCTGGRHRSVAFVHLLAQHLAPQAHIIVDHRDSERESYQVSL